MATDVIITITGLDEVQRMLEDAPRHIVASGFARAGRSAAEVFEAELQIRTPVRSDKVWNDETFSEFKQETGGDLKGALVSIVELDSQFRGVHISTGFGKQGYVANFVEYGHKMVTHKARKQRSARAIAAAARFGISLTKTVAASGGGKREVGFVPAHPFMRPAFDAAGDRAIDAFCGSLAATVRQEYGP